MAAGFLSNLFVAHHRLNVQQKNAFWWCKYVQMFGPNLLVLVPIFLQTFRHRPNVFLLVHPCTLWTYIANHGARGPITTTLARFPEPQDMERCGQVL